MTSELADGVYHLDLGGVNAYLVDDGDVTLVDCGTPRDLEPLRAELDASGSAESALDRILVTHYDVDHVGTLGDLDTAAPIFAMDPDAGYVEGTRSPPLTNHKGLVQRATGWWPSRPDRDVVRVGDGETVGGFTAYHTPGHTPGHAVYHHPDLGVALLGDLVAEDDGRLETSGWVISYDTGQQAASVADLSREGLEFEVAAMGHGEPIRQDGASALTALAGRLTA